MEIVSEQSEVELAQRRAEQELRWPLRELTANLIRIVRGAGAPERLPHQLAEVTGAYQQYLKTMGRLPAGWDVSQALSIEKDSDRIAEMSDDQRDRTWALETIISGALQVAASRLVYQNTQAAAGSSQMHQGLRDYEKWVAKYRSPPSSRRR